MGLRKHLWAIVLAGGEGRRLRPLIRRVHGDERPKQYATLVGSRSMLRHTIDRAALAVPPERIVVVTQWRHVQYVTPEVKAGLMPRVLVQPEDRGTAAGVLLPAHWIQWGDPAAIVAVFPSDHFVLEEAAFIDHVLEVAAFVSRHPRWIVLIGAQPSEPEPEYGWIEPGRPVGSITAGPIWRVRRFWEKPSEEEAHGCFARGCLWNTFVFVAHVGALIEAGWRFLPELSYRLAPVASLAHAPENGEAVREAYALAPQANFSEALL